MRVCVCVCVRVCVSMLAGVCVCHTLRCWCNITLFKKCEATKNNSYKIFNGCTNNVKVYIPINKQVTKLGLFLYTIISNLFVLNGLFAQSFLTMVYL